MRAIKRTKTRDKREQAHREALRAVQHAETKEGPRSAAGRIPGAFAGEGLAKAHQVLSPLCPHTHLSCSAPCTNHAYVSWSFSPRQVQPGYSEPSFLLKNSEACGLHMSTSSCSNFVRKQLAAYRPVCISSLYGSWRANLAITVTSLLWQGPH